MRLPPIITYPKFQKTIKNEGKELHLKRIHANGKIDEITLSFNKKIKYVEIDSEKLRIKFENGSVCILQINDLNFF